MRNTILLSLATFAASAVNGHAIFQRIRVNDVDQGQLVGVRAPSVNNPVLNVLGDSIACNTGLKAPVSSSVVTIPAGAKVGAWYEHVLGGPQIPNDPDNPIAHSHKGPLQVYLAKVDDAATADWTGVDWFKVAEEGLDTTSGKWGVDSLIAGDGWWNFTMPACVAAGQYLMRVELIGIAPLQVSVTLGVHITRNADAFQALHSAYGLNGAQFYMSCANIEVTGSGTTLGNDTVKFPGAYTPTDPGIKLNIYNGTIPNNDLKPYPIPGPTVLQC